VTGGRVEALAGSARFSAEAEADPRGSTPPHGARLSVIRRSRCRGRVLFWCSPGIILSALTPAAPNRPPPAERSWPILVLPGDSAWVSRPSPSARGLDDLKTSTGCVTETRMYFRPVGRSPSSSTSMWTRSGSLFDPDLEGRCGMAHRVRGQLRSNEAMVSEISRGTSTTASATNRRALRADVLTAGNWALVHHDGSRRSISVRPVASTTRRIMVDAWRSSMSSPYWRRTPHGRFLSCP